MMENFTDKLVWITGASSGLGESLAYAFSNAGARVILSARRKQELERVKMNCSNPASVEILTLDLTQTEELSEKVYWVVQNIGKIDILINNAGISQRSLTRDTSMAVYRRIMEVNYFGTIQLSLAVLPHFLLNNKGLFVVISSVAGKVGCSRRSAYCASKHALEGFFGSLQTEITETGIKILMVNPGPVKTNIAQHALTGDGSPFNRIDMDIENGITAEACTHDILKAISQNKKVLFPSKRTRKHSVFPLGRVLIAFQKFKNKYL
jgi:short-subunit dehydrogenase